jgi:ABC-type taurine transport system ATPase subunit
MKLNLNLRRKFQQFCLLLICIVVLNFQSDFPNLQALPMDNYQGEIVIEELRLKVPAASKAAWLTAEKEVWDPWLSSQKGFFWGDNYIGIKKRKKL